MASQRCEVGARQRTPTTAFNTSSDGMDTDDTSPDSSSGPVRGTSLDDQQMDEEDFARQVATQLQRHRAKRQRLAKKL